jgi:hypothetical protein
MMKFSSEKLAELVEALPKSDYHAEGAFQNAHRSDGFVFLYNNVFLPFVKHPNREFTLDVDLFEFDDIGELYKYCCERGGSVKRALLVANLFAQCQPDTKVVQFV